MSGGAPARFSRGGHARRPRPRVAFGRPLPRRVDPHLPAVGRQVGGIVEIVDRPFVIWMSRSGSMCVPTIHATWLRSWTSTSLSTTTIVFENISCPSPQNAFMILRAWPG
jgi:hypothetical protein